MSIDTEIAGVSGSNGHAAPAVRPIAAESPQAGPAPRILSVATAVPPHRLTQAEARAFGAEYFGADMERIANKLQVYDNAGIDSRYFCAPQAWYAEDHDFGEKNAKAVDSAVALLKEAAVKALDRACLRPEDIDTIVTASTTTVAVPALDARLMEELPFRRDIRRLPLFGYGCLGGVLGLSRAAELARAAPGSRVLLLGVECCSLTFCAEDRSMLNLVATALFADGAGAVVLEAGKDASSPTLGASSRQGQSNGGDHPGEDPVSAGMAFEERGATSFVQPAALPEERGSRAGSPALAAWGEYTWPASIEMVGWDVSPAGLGIVMSGDIPSFVRREVQPVADKFLRSAGLSLENIDRLVCHPGGAKVLDALDEVFGAVPGIEWSRTILSRYGNMSGATVLFVLEHALEQGVGGRWLMSSLGPGFSAGFIVIEN